MNILILHGIQGHAGKHWQQWLHDELQKKNHNVIMPTLPNPNKPDRKEWLESVQELLVGIDPTTLIIVGHSLGVATALDYIEESEKQVHGLISVAGFGIDYGEELNSYFMKEKNIDFKSVRLHCKNIAVIYGDDDPYVPQDTLGNLSEVLNADEYIIAGGGHINTDTGYTDIPVVLELIENDFKI